MKRILLVIVLAAFATAAWAQGTQTPKKPSCAGFVSNGFWDNWEVSGAVGLGTALSNGKDLGALSNRLGFEGNVSITKWVHPVTGIRLQLQGGYFNNYDAQWGKMEWPYMFLHADFMFNASNWIGGYRDDRAYYAVPFAGFGYMASNFTDQSKQNNHSGFRQNFAFTFGLLNKFRMSPSVDFNIELKSMLVPSRISPVEMGGSYLFGFSATAGFTYRFNKRGWERGVPGFTNEDIMAFQTAVAEGNAALESVKAENARLADELKAAREQAEAARNAAASAAAKAAETEQVHTPCPTSTILYDYGTSKLSPKEKTRLELMADVIKSGPKDKVYKIEGHADHQTGTPAGNERVAQNRAKSVYDFLVSKGVNPKQLTYEGKGDKQNPYEKHQKANRSVIIK